MLKLNELTFEIIHKCPNNCIYCSSNSSMECSNYKVDYETFKKVIDDVSKLNLKKIYISGGEPLLHEDLISMIYYCHNKRINVSVYTSGIILENNKPQFLDLLYLEKLKKSGIDKIIFNIPAIEEEIYDEIMGTSGRLNLLKVSIKNCISIGIFTEIHFVPMKKNIKQIDKVIEYCENTGVNKISFLKLVLQGRALDNKDELYINNNETNNFRNKILSYISDNKLKVNMRLGTPLSGIKRFNRCSAGCEKIVIRYDGDVLPCETFKYLNFIEIEGDVITPDNIYKDGFLNIYKNSKLLNYLRREIIYLSNEEGCSSCPVVGKFII